MFTRSTERCKTGLDQCHLPPETAEAEHRKRKIQPPNGRVLPRRPTGRRSRNASVYRRTSPTFQRHLRTMTARKANSCNSSCITDFFRRGKASSCRNHLQGSCRLPGEIYLPDRQFSSTGQTSCTSLPLTTIRFQVAVIPEPEICCRWDQLVDTQATSCFNP